VADVKYLVENEFAYPVSFNGKTRFTLTLGLDLDRDAVEQAVLTDANTLKYLDGKPVRKVVVVPGRIVNIVF